VLLYHDTFVKDVAQSGFADHFGLLGAACKGEVLAN
jgi:hypothetical protein